MGGGKEEGEGRKGMGRKGRGRKGTRREGMGREGRVKTCCPISNKLSLPMMTD